MRQEFYETGRQLLSLSDWKNRLIFWVGAIIIGLFAAGFAYVADSAQKLFMGVVSYNRFLPFFICPFVLGITVLLTVRFCPYAAGSGIPQAIAARNAETHQEKNALLGVPNIIGKIVLTAFGLLGGASIGREGPTVQVGAGLLYLGSYFGKMDATMARSVILAGAAAGIAAAFNTPLAGIVFAIEEMARAFEYKHSSVVLTAIIFAGASSLSILGNYSYFGYDTGNYNLVRDLWAILALGAGGGILGGLFSRTLIDGGKKFYTLCKTKGVEHPAVFAIVCGLLLAFLGLITNNATYGSGYEQTKNLLYGKTAGSWLYTAAKFLATAISGFSGIPGGIFSPSLSVGAGLGASMSPWFPATPIAGMVLLGMTSYFAGVTQAPITAFIIVLEITGGQSLPVPLIAASVMAARLSRVICPVSLYHALAKDFSEKLNFVSEERRLHPR